MLESADTTNTQTVAGPAGTLAAIAIERRWSKQEILEAYLNLVTYRGELQGISAASRVIPSRQEARSGV